MDETNWPTGWTRAALELCVLACIAELGTTHGYQVARRLAEHGLGEVKGGTLYPVLTRLEEQGLTTTRWVDGLGGPGRKLVQVSDAGSRALAERREQWGRWTARVAHLLDTPPSSHPTAQLEETR
jgi:PadR family transcriptional regulator PadR